MAVSFIGLGVMGKGMAKNLVRAGFDVIVYDIRKEPIQELVNLGAASASSAKEASELSNQAVITMVRDDAQTEEVILGKEGVLEGIREGAIIIMSTVSPSLVRRLAQKVMKEKGLPVLDAPVSGAWVGAEAGTLSIMVGAPEHAVQEYRPLLEAMGERITYCGSTGTGEIAKLTNGMIFDVTLAVVSEALALGVAQGLDKGLLLDIYNKSSGGSWVTKNWDMLSEMRRNVTPPNTLQTDYKDLGLALGLANEKGISVPLTTLCSELDLYIRE